MGRPAPLIKAPDIVTRGWLSPNGAHTMEVEVPGGMVRLELSADQVDHLERACGEFKRHVLFADGGPEVRNRRPFAIEVG